MYFSNPLVNSLSKIHYKGILRNYKRYPRKKLQTDPGIRTRTELINQEEEITEIADEDFDLESDFMHVGKSHVEYTKEMKIHKERERYFVTRQKYFKQKFPNFLTWSDKLQIRHLHKKDPEEWTIEKLSDGFPALPEVIAKVATSNWTKSRVDQIHNHDQAVKKNWRMFREERISELPPDLVEHLKKFGNRDLKIKPYEISDKLNVTTTKSMLAPDIKIGNEFSTIITSYKRLKNQSDGATESPRENNIGKPPRQDTNMRKTYEYSSHLTLNKFEEKLIQKAQTKNISPEEELILKTFEMDEKENPNIEQTANTIPNVSKALDVTNNKSSDVGVIVKNKNDYSYLDYPEKITIPKRVLKLGCTYKLNDCYYDDDGEFLYRVPGMYK